MGFSEADFIAMRARLQRNLKSEPTAPAEGCSKESDLHEAIIGQCRAAGWIYFHGSMAHRAMRTAGECDFTILADKGRVFFIEAKTRIGKLSPEQLGVKLWAEKLGHTIHIVRSLDDFIKVVT